MTRQMNIRRWFGIWPGILAILAGISFFAWTLVHSDALERASRIYHKKMGPESLPHALRLCLDHLDREPWDTRAHKLAGLCLSQLDFPELAGPYYAKAGPLNLDESLIRAFAILRSNKRDEAIQTYVSIIAKWPLDPRAYRILSGIYLSRRQYEELLGVSLQLSRLEGCEIEGHRLAGTAQHLLSMPEAAVTEFEMVLKLDPQVHTLPPDGQAQRVVDLLDVELSHRVDPVLDTMRGKAFYQLGNFSRAKECWEHAIGVDPTLSIALVELGRVALAENRPSDARVFLENALKRDTNDLTALFSLRMVYVRLGLNQQAEEIRRRAEVLQKQSPPPARGMGSSTSRSAEETQLEHSDTSSGALSP